MNYEFDTHTHTLVSGHAYHTMSEMAQAAAAKGLKMIGITDHAPQMPGAPHLYYFSNLRYLDREELSRIYGIALLLGAEANIVDKNGNLDLSDRVLGGLDVVIASLHIPCFAPGTREENTRAAICALRNPLVDIIGHPEDGRYPMDYEAVVQAAKEEQKFLEINNSSFMPGAYRKNGRENGIEILKLCKKHQLHIVINSDAHSITEIGNYRNVEPLLRETQFPEELIANTSVTYFRERIAQNKRKAGILRQ